MDGTHEQKSDSSSFGSFAQCLVQGGKRISTGSALPLRPAAESATMLT
jgi:hypothetical protein